MHEVAPVASESSPALRFLGAIMRPVVRLCMRLGVSANQANDLMRWLFVDEFYRTENLWHRRQPFASRAALLSGLSRKEVGRLREVDEVEDAVVTERRNRATRVLFGWRTDKRFLDDSGKPKVLPLKSTDNFASFHTLVSAYSGDVPPRTVLDELKRSGCIEVLNDQIEMIDSVYGPQGETEDFLEATADVIRALGNTADYNVSHLDDGKRRLARVWYQNNIPLENLEEAQALIRETTVNFGREMDARLAKLAHRDRQAGRKYGRAGLGAFYFQD